MQVQNTAQTANTDKNVEEPNDQSAMKKSPQVHFEPLFGCFKYNTAILKSPSGQNLNDEMLKEFATFNDTLNFVGINVFHLNDSNYDLRNLGENVLIINGTALVLKPKNVLPQMPLYISTLLSNSKFHLNVLNFADQDIFACASDILFTGKEIFVGVGKYGADYQAAKAIAEVFPEYCVQAIEMPKEADVSLRHYVAVCGEGMLIMCETNAISKSLSNMICNRGKFSYKFISVPELTAINTLLLNNCLLHMGKEKLQKSFDLIHENVNVHGGLSLDKLLKKNELISSLCIIFSIPTEMPQFESFLTTNDLSDYLNC